MLNSLDPLHIVPGLFALDKQITLSQADGQAEPDPDLIPTLDAAILGLVNGLRRAAHKLDDQLAFCRT